MDSKSDQTFKPTMQLRYVVRVVKQPDVGVIQVSPLSQTSQPAFHFTERVLQQLWQGSKGTQLWEDVPTEPEQPVFVGDRTSTHCIKCGEAFVGQERIERTGDGLPMHVACAVSESKK